MQEVVDAEGEILEVPEEDVLDGEPIERLIASRADAAQQEREWKRRKNVLDAVILRKMETPRVLAGDFVAKTAQRHTPKTDAAAFATRLFDREVSRAGLAAVIAAARGFDDRLFADGNGERSEDDVVAAYREMTRLEPSAIWLEVSPVLRRAPRES